MNQTELLRAQIQVRIDDFLRTRTPILASISPDLAPFSDFSQAFLSGGKRFRAIFAYWGWHGVTEYSHPERLSCESARAEVIGFGSALEIFHAAALVHDDIIDNSDTRRGAPSIHRRFEALADAGEWSGVHRDFGIAASILFGDLLLSWADELMSESLDLLDNRPAAVAARREYATMRSEVTAGQYLDVLEENAWHGYSDGELIERARRILTYKSAKYSVEVPLALGALGAGGTEEQLTALRTYGLAVGTAFQLRDDVLGVFGDAAVTGKPSGDDLREGKRTLLVALTRRELNPQARAQFDAAIGNPDLTEEQILGLQDLMRSSGAVSAVERIIAESIGAGRAALADAPLGEAALAALNELAGRVSSRSA